MSVRQVTPILNVSDVAASIEWFESLGWSRSFCLNEGGPIAVGHNRNEHGAADFGGVCCGEAEIFLCRGAQGSRPGHIPPEVCTDETEGVWMYWGMHSTSDVDSLHAKAVELGYNIPTTPRDEPWGSREFHLRHPDGHTIRVAAGLAEK